MKWKLLTPELIIFPEKCNTIWKKDSFLVSIWTTIETYNKAISWKPLDITAKRVFDNEYKWLQWQWVPNKNADWWQKINIATEAYNTTFEKNEEYYKMLNKIITIINESWVQWFNDLLDDDWCLVPA